jgi:hypothetical protein
MRVPVAVVTVCRDRVPVIGSWPIRWTPSRRRLAVSPISRSAGRFVGRFPIPKSLVSVMMVSVRGAFPYCSIVVCLSSTCRLGVTPAVITLVREPSRCRARAAADRTGVEDETDLIGAADVEFVADDLLEEDPTRDRCVEHLGPGRTRPAGSTGRGGGRGPIGRGERMRGVGLPFAVDRAEGDSTQIEKSPTREIRSAIAWPISTCAESTRKPMSDSSS